MIPGLTFPDPTEILGDDAKIDMDAVVSQPPSVDDEDEMVEATQYEYPDRAGNTYVISGPWGTHRPQDARRRFATPEAAFIWARKIFGKRGPVRRIKETEDGGVWACEVRK